VPLQKSDPLKVYPQLKGSLPENLKHLKNTMNTLDWKVSRLLCTGILFSKFLLRTGPTCSEGWAGGYQFPQSLQHGSCGTT
jgi:hypothetical protein